MKTLHIKITNGDEILLDCDTNGVLAVVNQEDTIAALSRLSGVTCSDMLNMIDGLNQMKNDILQDHPELELMRRLHELLKDKEDKETEKENEKDEPKPSCIEALLDLLTSKD